MQRSAISSLSFWYLLVIMLLSVGFSVVLYSTSTAELDGLLHRQEILQEIMVRRGAPSGYMDLAQERIIQIEQSKKHIVVSLIDFNVVILFLGGVVSFYLAKRTLQPIEEALEAQKRFTADASHELRTPLTIMKTEIEVAMRNKNLDLERSKQLLRSNLEEVNKLETLSNSLLTLAQQEEKSRTLYESCSLKKVVQEAIDHVAKQAKDRSIIFVVEGKDVGVLGNYQSLSQVVVILLDNAIKYSKEGSQITISTDRREHKGIITVRDNGMGIAVADLPLLFNRFYRADRSRSKQKVDGYGLGLAIAHKIITAHHGTITVESVLGEGSAFSVLLPLNSSASSQELLVA